jgi:hypothetical protein
MLKASLVLGCFLTLGIASSYAADPAKTDGDKYKVILENERVRVFAYDDKPGDKTHQHGHQDFVLYALAPFKRKLTFPDGHSISREFKTGEVIWMKKQTHVGENIGTTDTHVLIVELKEPPTSKAATQSSFK